MPPKPNVLILGGLVNYSKSLALLLVPLNGEPLVSHLRIVDKPSVNPPTCYLGSEFPKVLRNPVVEYKQMNLTIEDVVRKAFEPPDGKEPYTHIFDFTGDTSNERTDEMQIKATCEVAYLCGREAARRGVKAYVRNILPCFNTKSTGAQSESVPVEPFSSAGAWWYEMQRVLASISDLPLVILRVGFGYGPYTNFGKVTIAMLLAACYAYLKRPMKALMSPGSHGTNTVHVDDIAGAMWACAEWIAPLGRAKADQIAGEKIPFHSKKDVAKSISWMPNPDKVLVAPLFNLVDDSSHTFLTLGQTVTSYFGTTFEFHNGVTDFIVKFKQDSIVEDANELHVGTWTEMITKSNPPIPNTQISPYMQGYLLKQQAVGLKNDKIKSVIGYKLKRPTLGHPEITEILDGWKAEGTWPVLD